MIDYWTTNIARLTQQQPALAQQLSEVPLHNVRLMPNASGIMIGQTWDVTTQQWVALCNPDDPVTEAENDAAALWSKDARVFCCFGLGLGYFPVAMARRLLPYQRMVIFDPNPMHYLAMLHAIDAEPLMGQRHVETLIGDNLLAVCEQWWLGLQAHEKLHIAMPVRSGFTTLNNVQVYDALLEKTGQMLLYHGVGLATWKQFGRHIGYSDWGNLPEYCVTPGLQELQGLWAGKPAVCVAAGPSLKKNIALLRNPEFRSKVAVITVGTTYALLQSLGIQPDIVTTIDFQRLNWTDQFLHIPLDDAPPLVYLHSTYPTTVRRWPGVKYVGLNSSDTTLWLAQFMEPKASAGEVQSVAHLNVVVAQMLGASPILLVGQDLSMSPSEHHALGARAQDQAPEVNYEAHIQMPGYDGQPVWSRHSLLSMKLVFERLIAAKPACQVVNCTEGGVALLGVPNAPLADTLAALPDSDGPCLRAVVEQQHATYSPQVKWDELTAGVDGILAGVQRLREAATSLMTDIAAWERAETPEEKHVLYAAIQATDVLIGTEQLAFGQIAIRRFEIIEMMAAIPPAVDSTSDDLMRLSIERLRMVAQCILEDTASGPQEHETVPQIIGRARQRLQDMMDLRDGKPVTHDHFVRQSFPAIRQQKSLDGKTVVRLSWEQQQYYALQAVARYTHDAQRYISRVARLIERQKRERDQLGWAYLQPRKD